MKSRGVLVGNCANAAEGAPALRQQRPRRWTQSARTLRDRPGHECDRDAPTARFLDEHRPYLGLGEYDQIRGYRIQYVPDRTRQVPRQVGSDIHRHLARQAFRGR